MSCTCCNSDCHCNAAVVGGLPLLVAAGVAIYGIVKLIARISITVSLPAGVWIPLSALAVAATLWGLWIGFTAHGRAEPLAVGVFGLLVTALGFALFAPLALVGVLIVLGATVWSALAYRARRVPA
jgi:hypothetical protein